MRILCIILFLIFLPMKLVGWESHPREPNAKDENGDMQFSSEHKELTIRALSDADAYTHTELTDLCGITKDYNEADMGWATLKYRSFCADNFSELPDYFHSMEDYIYQGKNCPPLLGWDSKDCHSFEHFMGGLNATHFPPQTKTNYTQYHKIALALRDKGNALSSLLVAFDAETEYGEYVTQCRTEALLYESIGQHYLQDQWAMGHMWYRWGGPEVSDFVVDTMDLLNWTPDAQQAAISYSMTIGAVSGMIHGWKSTVDPILKDGPFDFLANDALSYYSTGVNWTRPGNYINYAGTGDLFKNEQLDANTNQKHYLDTCMDESIKQVIYTGFGQTDSEISKDCWNNFATNKAMAIGLGYSPSTLAIIAVKAAEGKLSDVNLPRQFQYLNDYVLKNAGRELMELATVFLWAALKDPLDTYLAEGFTTSDRDVPLQLFFTLPNNKYDRYPSYFDPARNAPGDPADQVFAGKIGNDLFGVRQVKYFNKCHADVFCKDASLINDYRQNCEAGSFIKCEICEELGERFYLGDPPICSILSGVNPDPDNENPPKTRDEVVAWCKGKQEPLDSEYPKIYSGLAEFKEGLTITWDEGSTGECKSTGLWTITLNEDGSAKAIGEYTSRPQFNSSGVYCVENDSGSWGKFYSGTHEKGKVLIDVFLENDIKYLEGSFNNNTLTGSYSNSWTGVLPGWGELTKTEALTVNLMRKKE